MVLLGKRLKALRVKLNMTQQQLGKEVNVTKVSICCYENGTRVPALETLIDLSRVFDVTLDYLIGNDEYIVSDTNANYGMRASSEEIELIKELRKNQDLYSKMVDDPKRMVELISKKVR